MSRGKKFRRAVAKRKPLQIVGTINAYCALLADPYSAQRATLSNNANMVAMGAQTTGIETAKVLLEHYLGNAFDPNSRSGPKVARIAEIEAEEK